MRDLRKDEVVRIGRFSPWAVASAGLLSVLCLVAVACGDSSPASTAKTAPNALANAYPTAVRANFLRACTAASVASAAGKLGESQARQACSRALTCLQQRLTIGRFNDAERKMQSGEANPAMKVVVSCEQGAFKKLVG